MRHFLRLLTLWLLALALPLQGAAAATVMGGHAGASSMPHTMVMPDGTAMDATAMPAAPCHQHAGIDKSGCGGCCGPLLTQRVSLTVAPVALRRTSTPPVATRAPVPVFLTGGTDRPPRPFLA